MGGSTVNIALLGSGHIMKRLAISIIKEGHRIEVVGTNPNADIKSWELDEIGINPEIVKEYSEICNLPVDAILMFSYAPLIKGEYLCQKQFINIHYALLPRFRGFHGFIWSLINDEPNVGYTVHKVNEGIDSGDIYFQHSIKVNDNVNIIELRESLDNHLSENIGKYLTLIEKGCQAVPQDDSKAIYVTKRNPEQGEINWNWNARLIFNHIRALTPPMTPGAYSFYKDRKIVFTKARYLKSENYYSTVGKILNINNTTGSILVKCSDRPIEITEVSLDGINMIPAELFKKVGESFSSIH